MIQQCLRDNASQLQIAYPYGQVWVFSNDHSEALPIQYGLKKNFETQDDTEDGDVEHMIRYYEEATLFTGQTYENGKQCDDFIYGSGLQYGKVLDTDKDFSFDIE